MALDNNHNIKMLGLYARNGDLGAMKQMVSAFYIAPEVFNGTEEYTGDAIMHCAAEGGHIDVMEWLIGRGASVRVKTGGKWGGNEPMHCAAKKGKLDVMKWLNRQGADIKAGGAFGFTPLHIAAEAYRNGDPIHYTNRIDMAEWLLKQGADINAKASGGTTPIHCAVQAGQLEIVKWLKKNGAKLDVTNSDGTLMDNAVKYGKTEIIEWLKEQTERSVAKVEVVSQKNTETVVQPIIGYERYLKELGHTTDSVAEEMIPIKSLQVEIEDKKRENDELSEELRKQQNEEIILKKELLTEL